MGSHPSLPLTHPCPIHRTSGTEWVSERGHKVGLAGKNCKKLSFTFDKHHGDQSLCQAWRLCNYMDYQWCFVWLLMVLTGLLTVPLLPLCWHMIFFWNILRTTEGPAINFSIDVILVIQYCFKWPMHCLIKISMEITDLLIPSATSVLCCKP